MCFVQLAKDLRVIDPVRSLNSAKRTQVPFPQSSWLSVEKTEEAESACVSSSSGIGGLHEGVGSAALLQDAL